MVLRTAYSKNGIDELGDRHQFKTSFYRSAFLSSLACIFLIAFWSFYTSFPGLLSSSGLEPAVRLFPYIVAPPVYRSLIQSGIIDVDSLCELVACAGVVLSCIIMTGYVQHGLAFLILTGMYTFLAMLGGTFYSFQWDTLLAEVGTVTAICYAPWNSPRIARNQQPIVASWPLRFLLFKLMFMSGVVKIQAECPTWKNLTALEYHFATQCLPGPLAWYAHQLPPFLLRLSVAVTFLVEIPAAFLLLAPVAIIRRTGAVLQILLQIMIVLTGNYNFFNMLTIALCLPCMERDAGDLELGKVRSVRKKHLEPILHHVLAWAFLGWSFQKMFEVAVHESSGRLNISLTTTKADCDELSELILPTIIVMAMLIVGMKAITNVQLTGSPFILLQGVVCIIVIGIIGVPLCEISPKLRLHGFPGSKRVFQPLYRNFAQPYKLANGYGFFRKMTGVGTTDALPSDDAGAGGWAGVPPSIVARPEIVVEGLFADKHNATKKEWIPINFRQKPGNVQIGPQQVASHQPRLDWQMWFAALGSYHHNPWFINLVKKLQDGCEPVLALLDDPNLTDTKHRLLDVRSGLYSYDFTRFDTAWSRQIPGARILEPGEMHKSTGFLSAWTKGFVQRPKQYWTRKFVRAYMPRIPQGDKALEGYLQRQGYDSTCIESRYRCLLTPTRWCYAASYIRERRCHLIPIGVLALYFIFRIIRGFHEILLSRRKITGKIIPKEKTQ